MRTIGGNVRKIKTWLQPLGSGGAVRPRKPFPNSGRSAKIAAIPRVGRVAGVHRDGVAWLGCGERGFLFRPHTLVDLADSVACFASPLTKELLVVTGTGEIVRVPMPG